MMDAMEVAAALRCAAENAGCALDTIASGREGCPDCSCAECCKASAKWANDAADAIERCALPEGVEWPRYESGEPVRFGNLVGDRGGAWMEHPVDEVLFRCDGIAELFGDGNSICFERGESVVRIVLAADGEPLEVGQTVYRTRDLEPVEIVSLRSKEYDGVRTVKCKDRTGFVFYAPNDLIHQRPVLDADGVEIREKRDVWWICEGDERGVHAERLHVESIGDDGFVTCSPFNGGIWVELEPSELYVKKPALDADGVLCREGDEVWEVRSHRRREIIGIHYRDYETGEPLILCDGDDAVPIPAMCVTHAKPEPPESWERIEEDAKVMANPTLEERVSLVRRCRALAEMGQ